MARRFSAPPAFNGGPPETTLTGATITIDDRTSKSDLTGVIVHESKHAGDARRDPAGFVKERKENMKQFPNSAHHDKRSQEQRANQFAKQYAREIAKQARGIRKRQKEDEKRKKKEDQAK